MALLEYDKAGAAEYLGTSQRHIERLWAERKIAGFKVGRFVRFKKSDLNAYAEKHRLEALR
jgi:excisionase family DNA binding protein